MKSTSKCLHAVCDGSCYVSRAEGNREGGPVECRSSRTDACSMIDSNLLACSVIDSTSVFSELDRTDVCLHRQRRVQSRIESWLVRKPP